LPIFNLLFIFVAAGFELRDLCLLGRHSVT
jgi:hypothetical protein